MWLRSPGWHCPLEASWAIGAQAPLACLPVRWRVITLVALVGCATTEPSTKSSATRTIVTKSAPAGPSDAQMASTAQQQINDLHASWGEYVSAVTFHAGVLSVAIQSSEQELADKVAAAVRNVVTLGESSALRRAVNWVEVTDGAGNHLTQESVG